MKSRRIQFLVYVLEGIVVEGGLIARASTTLERRELPSADNDIVIRSYYVHPSQVNIDSSCVETKEMDSLFIPFPTTRNVTDIWFPCFPTLSTYLPQARCRAMSM